MKRFESAPVDPAPLGKPLTFEFSQRTAKNRFMKAALSERQSSWSVKDESARGIPSKELINVYRRWGEGEFGVILTGNVMMFPNQLEAAGNPIVPLNAPFSGERFERFSELATEAKKHGSLLVAQVSHPGRQVTERINPNPISSGDIQLQPTMGMSFGKPRPASESDIADIIASFTHTAEYLYKAGFDGIQLHGAHGYLLAQFLSQVTNNRTDSYGGSLTARAKLLLEIAASIRARVPATTGFILSIKLNSVEFQEKGITADECRDLCVSLEQAGFDFVELSGGNYEVTAFLHKSESTKKREAFFLQFAETIVPALSKTKVYITGGLRTAAAMVQCLQTVDGIGLGRPITQEPYLPRDILSGKVTGCIDPALDQANFGLTLMLSTAQMSEMGRDYVPLDMSDEENVKVLLGDFGPFMEERAKDVEGEKYAPLLLSKTGVAYATANL